VAKELLITGAELDAGTAPRFGLVNRVAEPGAALAGALDLTQSVCLSSPVAVRATLAAIDAQLEELDDAGWRATAGALATITDSDDLLEGIATFFERRDPRWSGR
jgi:enoyl-CoA hydratase/carnithine racemase